MNMQCLLTGKSKGFPRLRPKELGIKIFEGDIVRALEEGEVIGYCEIKFGEYSVGHVGFYTDWYAGNMAKFFRNDLGHWVTHETIEVIGNRADNKELLEVDNGT